MEGGGMKSDELFYVKVQMYMYICAVYILGVMYMCLLD